MNHTIDGQPFAPRALLPEPPAGERWIGPIPSETLAPAEDGDRAGAAWWRKRSEQAKHRAAELRGKYAHA